MNIIRRLVLPGVLAVSALRASGVKLLIISGSLFLVSVTATVQANVIFSTYGPGDSFNVSSSDHVNGPDRGPNGDYFVVGQGFTPQFD